MRGAPFPHRGFTLVEVLVALVIVAFGMGALMAALTSSADTTARLRDRTLAEWIALDQVAAVRLAAEPGANGSSDGEVEMAGREWRWRREILDPGIAGVRRIDVEVATVEAPDVILGRATGFLGEAVVRSNGRDPDWSLQSAAQGGGTPTAPPGSDLGRGATR